MTFKGVLRIDVKNTMSYTLDFKNSTNFNIKDDDYYMEKRHYKNNKIWKVEFKEFLNLIFSVYQIDYAEFCESYFCDKSTVRYWFKGRNLPQKKYFESLKFFLTNKIPSDTYHKKIIYGNAKNILERNKQLGIFYILKQSYPEENQFIVETLSLLYNFSKNNLSFTKNLNNKICPTGKTQAIIFDFDGTLTYGKTNRTTWEQLWTSLGYDVKLCQNLHMKYDRKEITHTEWCKLTEIQFCERNLHKNILDDIAQNITLINGIEDTFKQLQSRNIKIYIVSGSILYIIKHALGELYQYIDETKANIFKFDDNGYLIEIVGTKYDFEGKADFISNVAYELNISPQDILFVGNSLNDRFAYKSGVRTLCINPKMTDPTNLTVWNKCIPTCENLLEIMNHV